MCGLAHRRVVHVQVVANGADHDFPGVEPHPDAHLDAVGALHLVGVSAHRRLHGHGRVTGPHSMVFVGHRRPEQGHDAIAQHLVHGAFVAVHRVHHDMQRRIQQCLGRFRIEP